MKINGQAFGDLHVFISSAANVIGIFATLVLFYVWGSDGELSKVGAFALLSSGYFLASQIATLGVDLNILSSRQSNANTYIEVDSRFIFLALAFVVNFLIFSPFVFSGAAAAQGISDENIIFIGLAASIYVANQVTMAFIQRAGLLLINSIIYASKHLGFLLGAIYITVYDQSIGLFFLFGEMTALLCLAAFFLKSVRRVEYLSGGALKHFNVAYFFSGFSQFTYSGLFKVDTFVLFLISDLRVLGVYAILSSVCEGLINFKSAFHPAIHNYFRACKFSLDRSGAEMAVGRIYAVSKYIGLLIFPAYIILHLIMFEDFPDLHMIFGSAVLSLSVAFSSSLFLHYFYFSVWGRPIMQAVFSIAIMVFNAVLDVVMFGGFGVLGVALATAITYILFHLVLSVFVRKSLILQ